MKVECPNCKKPFRCDDNAAGKNGRCSACKTKFRINGNDEPITNIEQTTSIATLPARNDNYQRDEPSSPEPTPIEDFIEQRRDVLFEDELVAVFPDGSIEIKCHTKAEGKLALKTLRLIKKQLSLQLREINAALRNVRHGHTDATRRRTPMFRGGGQLGQIIRTIQTISRATDRVSLANSVQPLHDSKQRIDSILTNIQTNTVRLEATLLRM